MITTEHSKEGISLAYITAVVASARHNLSLGGFWDYGIDGTIKHVESDEFGLSESGFALDFQAKASVDWILDGSDIVYDLDATAYNKLAKRYGRVRSMPLYLLVMCLPRDASLCVVERDDHLDIANKAYFYRVPGPLTPNSSSVRIRIPAKQIFNQANLIGILVGISKGEILP